MMNSTEEIQYGTCPCCNGAGRVPAEEGKNYGCFYGYDKDTHTLMCTNCGGQYMYGKPTGKVRLRRDNGEPCTHKYSGYNAYRCLTRYTCEHCGDRYEIDSGD